MACELLEENRGNCDAWKEGGKLKSRLKGFFLVEIGSSLVVPFNILEYSGSPRGRRREKKKKKEKKKKEKKKNEPRDTRGSSKAGFLRGNDIIVYSHNAMIVQ